MGGFSCVYCYPKVMDKKPWERLANESAEAYEAFKAVLDAGPYRSRLKVYQEFANKPDATQSSGAWNNWAREYSWVDRCRSWDEEQDRILFEAKLKIAKESQIKALEEFRAAHLQTARLAFENSRRILFLIEGFLLEQEAKGSSISSWEDALRAARVASNVEASANWADALSVSKLLDQLDVERLDAAEK